MICVHFCLRRLPILDLVAFQNYWRDVHAPLVARHAGTLKIAFYRQHHSVVDSPVAMAVRGRGDVPPFDGIAELGWASEDDLLAGAKDPVVRAANQTLLADERRFIDLDQSPIFVTRGIDIVSAPDVATIFTRTT